MSTAYSNDDHIFGLPSSRPAASRRSHDAEGVAVKKNSGGDSIYWNGSVIDKIKKYGWKIKDVPGEFRVIDKNDLNLDPRYQRGRKEKTIRKITANWSWRAFGVILVAETPSGQLNVFDGSNRTESARRRSDIDGVPCMVFKIDTEEEEAMSFLDTNSVRNSPSAIDKLDAQFYANDPAAIGVMRLISESGYEIANQSNGRKTIKCVRSLYSHYSRNKDQLLAVWPLILELCDNGPIHERILDSVVYIEAKISRGGLSLTKSPWKQRLLRLGNKGVMVAAAEASAYYSAGGSKIWAAGVVKAMNHGCRNKLRLNDNDQV